MLDITNVITPSTALQDVCGPAFALVAYEIVVVKQNL